MWSSRCYLVVLLLIGGKILCFGQDPQPKPSLIAKQTSSVEPVGGVGFLPDTLDLINATFQDFTLVGKNEIVDDQLILVPILDALKRSFNQKEADTLRFFHIGDSHIRGDILPNTIKQHLEKLFPSISYKHYGINGATCLTFTHDERIKRVIREQPDVLILSFGTNESHNRRYNGTVHYHQIDELIIKIRRELPDVVFLFTTPPGSYERIRGRRGRFYRENLKTAQASQTIIQYAKDKGYAYWDLYEVAGGRGEACKNWQSAKLMRRDHVHYFPEGYILQGELFSDAFINYYNQYVSNRLR